MLGFSGYILLQIGFATLSIGAATLNAQPASSPAAFYSETADNTTVDGNVTVVGNGRMTHGQAHFRYQGSREAPHLCPQIRRPGFVQAGAIELPAFPNKDELVYVVPTTVGGQRLFVQLDTGSADLYVLGPQVPREKTVGRRVFTSRNFRWLRGVSFELNYVGGDSAKGYVGRSPVGLGNVILEEQTVNVATDVRYPAIMDGLIGLGVGKGIRGQRAAPNQFLNCLISSIREPLFAASLRSGQPSSYQFGYIDRSKFRGLLKRVPVDPRNGQWQFQASGARIDDREIIRPMPSLVDTGSSLLRMQKEVVDTYYSKVPGVRYSSVDEGFILPCNARLPTLEILIEDYIAFIPGDLIRGPPVKSAGDCLGTLQVEVDNVQSFGVVFLKAQYVLFDLIDRRYPFVAFAPHA